MKARVSASLQTFLKIFNLFLLILSHVGNYDDCLYSNIFCNKVLQIHIFYGCQFPLRKDLDYLSKDMCSFK